jgi:hypothetical protein
MKPIIALLLLPQFLFASVQDVFDRSTYFQNVPFFGKETGCHDKNSKETLQERLANCLTDLLAAKNTLVQSLPNAVILQSYCSTRDATADTTSCSDRSYPKGSINRQESVELMSYSVFFILK